MQIEIFFKEWGKFECTKNDDCSLWKSYNHKNNKKEKNWNIGDFHFFKRDFEDYYSVHVVNRREDILPFESWSSEKEPPWWWKSYNNIKHNGATNKKDSNLKAALYSVAALFSMHCVNLEANNFLRKYQVNQVDIGSFGRVIVKSENLATPIDSRKWLFIGNNTIMGRHLTINSRMDRKRSTS